MKLDDLATAIKAALGNHIIQSTVLFDELTLELLPESLLAVCHVLKENPEFKFEQLMDVCGIDYLLYGVSEWDTERSTGTGFSRGVKTESLLEPSHHPFKERFAVIYHLLSITHGHRVRLKVFISEEKLKLPSVINLWPSANWFEREVFDLFGVVFENHPDLRRILTDYGFIGHPFRKDFPVTGHVEMRYSEKEGRVIYGPVEIEPRTLVPKVIRDDHRYDKV